MTSFFFFFLNGETAKNICTLPCSSQYLEEVLKLYTANTKWRFASSPDSRWKKTKHAHAHTCDGQKAREKNCFIYYAIPMWELCGDSSPSLAEKWERWVGFGFNYSFFLRRKYSSDLPLALVVVLVCSELVWNEKLRQTNPQKTAE